MRINALLALAYPLHVELHRLLGFSFSRVMGVARSDVVSSGTMGLKNEMMDDALPCRMVSTNTIR